MDAAALILRRCKVSPDTGGSGSPPSAAARESGNPKQGNRNY